MYIALYYMLYHFVFPQSTISSTFHFLYVSLLLSEISISGSDSKTWPGNALSDTKCSFHGWKISIRLASLMCWEISSLYLLLSIIFTIFYNPAFFKFNDFLDNFSKKSALHLYKLYHQFNTPDMTNNLNWQTEFTYPIPMLSGFARTSSSCLIFLWSDLLLEIWFFVHHCMY